MNATNQSKSAATSTPAAAPAGSPPVVEQKPGAIAEDDAPFDVMGALNRLSDGSNKPGEAKAESEDRTAEGSEETPESTEAATPEAEAEPAEAEAESAPIGDDAPATTASEDKTKPAAEEPAEAETAETPAEKTALQKRFDELTAHRHELESSLAQARERLASYDAAAKGKFDPGALEHVDSIETLATERQQLTRVQQWALAHPEGGEMPPAEINGTPVNYEPEQVRALLARTSELLYQALPAREQFLRAREQADAQAVSAYPWLKDTRTGAGAQVQAIIEATPGLRRLGPNYRTIAADALIGQTLREAGIAVDGKLVDRLKAERTTVDGGRKTVDGKSTPAVRKVPPAAPSRPGTVPGRVVPREAQQRAASKALSKGDGNVNAVAAAIAAKFG